MTGTTKMACGSEYAKSELGCTSGKREIEVETLK